MTESDNAQLAGWASALLDEVLVKAAIDIHKQERIGDEIEVELVFTVSSSGEDGYLAVTSPGSRGKTIYVEVPVSQQRTS